MNRQIDFDQLLDTWLDDGADVAPERFVWAAIGQAERTPQRGSWRVSLRGTTMRMQPAALVLGAAAVIVLAIASYLAFFAPAVGETGPSASPLTSPTEAAPSPASSQVAAMTPRPVETSVIDIGGALTGLQATGDAVYAATEDRIVRIDPATGDATELLVVPDVSNSCSECATGPEYEFAIGEGSLWVAYHYEVQSMVRRFDLASGELQAEIPIGSPEGGGAGASDVTVAFGSVWTVQCHSGTIARIDPASNQQVALIPFAEGAVCQHASAIAAYDDNSLWASAMTDDGIAIRGALYKLDPATNTLIGSAMVEGSATPCGRFASTNHYELPSSGPSVINSCPESEDSSLVFLLTGNLEEAPVGPASAVRLSGYLGDPVAFEQRIWVPRVSGRPLGQATLIGLDAEGEIVDLIQLGSETRVNGRSAIAMVVAFDAVWVGGDGTSLLKIPLSELSN